MQILFDERSDSFDLLNLNVFELSLIRDALLGWYREMDLKPTAPLLPTILSQDEYIIGAFERSLLRRRREDPEGDNVGGA